MRFDPPDRDTAVTAVARTGYAARALVYLSTGVFALLAAWERRPLPVGAEGALAQWADWPLGQVWLAAAAVGLVGFAAWRTLQAVLDADRLGRAPKALMRRAGKGVSAALHLALAWSAFQLLDASADLQETAQARESAARVLALPFGRALLLAVSGATLVAAAGNLLKASGASFGRELACVGLDRRWAVALGRSGFVARGAAFALVTVYLARAASTGDAAEVRSLGGALAALESQPAGSWLLTALALGFAAFGAYGLVQARFRRIRAPDFELGADRG